LVIGYINTRIFDLVILRFCDLGDCGLLINLKISKSQNPEMLW